MLPPESPSSTSISPSVGHEIPVVPPECQYDGHSPARQSNAIRASLSPYLNVNFGADREPVSIPPERMPGSVSPMQGVVVAAVPVRTRCPWPSIATCLGSLTKHSTPHLGGLAPP